MKIKLELRCFLFTASVICVMAALKIYNLRSSFYDLGVFDWNIWSIAHFGEWQRAFYGHVQPIMLLWSLLYKIYGNAYILVVLQSIILSVPILFIHKYYISEVTQSAYSWIAVFAYILYFPLWYNALFDFHLDHMVVPLGLLFYIAYQNKRWLWCIFTAVLVSMVKEPYALMTIGFGTYILAKSIADYNIHESIFRIYLRDQKEAILSGLFLIIFGFFYIYTALHVISPYFTQGNWIGFESSAYSWMGSSFQEIILFAVKNPLAIIFEVFSSPRKLFYLLCVFGGLAFLPILAPLELIPAVPILAISILSRDSNYYGIGHHYTAGLIPAFIIAFLIGMKKYIALCARYKISETIAVFLIISTILTFHVLLSPSPISRLFWSNKIWKYGNSAYIPADRNNIIKNAAKEFIPDNPEISVSVQNTINMAYLYRKVSPLVFPSGVFNRTTIPVFRNKVDMKRTRADYVVVDLKRPFFFVDRGCDWQYGKCKDSHKERQFIDLVENANKKFKKLFEYDGFLIMQNKQSEHYRGK